MRVACSFEKKELAPVACCRTVEILGSALQAISVQAISVQCGTVLLCCSCIMLVVNDEYNHECNKETDRNTRKHK